LANFSSSSWALYEAGKFDSIQHKLEEWAPKNPEVPVLVVVVLLIKNTK